VIIKTKLIIYGDNSKNWISNSKIAENGRQNETLRILVGLYMGCTHSIFPDVTLRRSWFEGQKEERRFLCTVSRVLSRHGSVRSHFGRFRIVIDVMCVCARNYEMVDHVIWRCERFRVERHRLIDAFAALNVGFGFPIRDLCALKKYVS
jgi:hypothetical protein